MEYPKSYLVWDLETTGLNPETDRIVEVACMKVENGEIVKTYSAILNHDIDIPEAAANVHGITREKAAAEGIDPLSVIGYLREAILESEAVMTHNGIRFDVPFLLCEMRRLDYCETDILWTGKRLNSRHIDTAAIYKAKKLGADRKWHESFYDFAVRVLDIKAYGVRYNVKTCCEELGIDMEGIQQHRALGDVTLTQKIYEKLCA